MAGLTRALLDALEPTERAVMVEDKMVIVMEKPSAALLSVVERFCKNNGIEYGTVKPGSDADKIAKKLPMFHDDDDDLERVRH